MLESTKERLKQAGIEQLVYEDFFDELIHVIQRMVDPSLDTKKRKSLLLASFQNPDGILDLISSYISILN